MPPSASSLPCSQLLANAGNWFLTSGILTADGGVARYYRMDSGNLPVSTEITGYAVSALCWLHQVTGEKKYLDGAERAAEFLVKEAWHPEYGLFPFEVAYPLPPAYFFDCGIIIRGLLALWRINKRQILLDVATACAYGMRQFRSEDGTLHPIISFPHFKAMPHQKKWSREPGCFQLKAALAWAEVGELTSDPVLKGWFDDAMQQALANESQFLPGSDDDEEVMNRLHAYGYFLEALLKRPEHMQVLVNGIEKTSTLLDRIAPKFERSDVFAQLLRLRVLCGKVGASGGAAVERLTGYQYVGDRKEVSGGFGFGKREGVTMPMVNPVSTAFAMQAIYMVQMHQAGGDVGELTDLI